MNSIHKILLALIVCISILSCSKDEALNTTDSEIQTKRTAKDCEVDMSLLTDEDRLKQSLAKFVSEALLDDALKNYLLSNLFIENQDEYETQNPEFLIADHLGDYIDIGSNSRFGIGQGTEQTLEDIMTEWVSVNDPDQMQLFQNICSQYSDFVLHFPWWSVDIINDNGDIESMPIGVIGAINPIECDGKYIRSFFHEGEEEIINVKAPLKKYVPIYVKKAEQYMKILNTPKEALDELVDNINIFYEECTFTENELLVFVKTIDCSDLQFVDYSKMAAFFKKNCEGVRHHETDCCDGEDNDGDGLIDCDDVEDCPCNVEICNDGCDNDNDGHIDEDDDDCNCDGQYQRDCVPEDNVCVGLKFGDAAWLNVCQLKEEEHIKVKVDLDAVLICNQSQGSQCATEELTDITVEGHTNKFFELQKIHPGHIYYDPLYITDEDNVLWMNESGTNYWKVFPLYIGFRKEYLSSQKNQWIPATIGSKISMSVFELDNNSVNATDSYTKTITTRHSFNAGVALGIDELISTNLSYTFDNTKVSSAVSTTSVNFEKDVWINDFTLQYWDEDKEHPDPTGVEGNTWYGQIPGNSETGLDGIYLEFRIHD